MEDKLKLLLLIMLVCQSSALPKQVKDSPVMTNDVAKIVEAISQVQQNVTVTPNNVDNVKVASGNWSNLTVNSTSSEEDEEIINPVKPLNISPDAKPTTVKKRPPVLNDDQENEDNLVESEEETTLMTNLEPPTVSILSTRGLRKWFEWMVSMRDPALNPAGTYSWRSIITTGLSSIFQQYNPFRGFFRSARYLDSDSLSKILAVYKHRDEIAARLASKELEADALAIMNYATKLELVTPVDEKSNSLELALSKGDSDKLPPPLNTIVSILNGQGVQIGKPGGLPDLGQPLIDKPQASETEVNIINGGLKLLYLLIPLLFIPFSGIENFFLAPLPPNLETFPGVLRLMGLQALLGPDYVLDYDAAYDPAYDTPGDEVGEEGAAAVPPEDLDDYTDYDYDTRRRKGTVIKKYKVKNSYGAVNNEMKPPPSRYGQSSYTSFKNKAANE